jgi:hypothetical protein
MLPRTPLQRWLYIAGFLALILLFAHQSSYTRPTLDHTAKTIDKALDKTVDKIGNIVSGPKQVPPFDAAVDDLTYVKEVLKNHEIGPEITYLSRFIRYVPDATDRPPMTEVDEDLFTAPFKEIKISSLSTLPAAKPLELHVKPLIRAGDVDASELLFAVSTVYERFKDKNGPIEEWARWFTDGHGVSNGAGLILTLHEAKDEELDAASATLASRGINATVMRSNPDHEMSGRYVDLIHKLWNDPSRESRKYFALIDDDTFFPHMSKLISTLAQYNPKHRFYIGTYTERMEWLRDHFANFAYGGGGIFLTAPMISELVGFPCLDKLENGDYKLGPDSHQGDRLLYNCIMKYSDIRITYQPLLQQADHGGDPGGIYESGRQPLSLHHYKSWHKHIPDKMHIVSDACGLDCILQRWQFKDNFILSNGYSVAEYPRGIDFATDAIEDTFDMGTTEQKAMNFAYVYGGMRARLSNTGRKRAWQLLDSRRVGNGTVTQIYFKSRGDPRWIEEGKEELPINDSIIVLTWMP